MFTFMRIRVYIYVYFVFTWMRTSCLLA